MVRAASSCLISWLQAAPYHAFKGNDLTPDISLLPRGYSELKLRYHRRKTRTRRRATLFHLGRLSWRPLSSIQTTSAMSAVTLLGLDAMSDLSPLCAQNRAMISRCRPTSIYQYAP